MERYGCLNDLRMHMKVDKHFANCYPFETNIIEKLISIDSNARPNVDEVLTIYAKEFYSEGSGTES